ncbi:MAG: hypothetical protein LBH25_12560 [Fibromonadaceae bacterium]|jgi:biopolymer transport protein ExbB/TolQ|nr:hypothetical protein [Fibromonadaceae bacterium]
MTLYTVLFLMGFMLAICLLAYSSMQVAELGRRTDVLENSLRERYSKSVKEFATEKKKEEVEVEGEEVPEEANNEESQR